MTNTIENPLPLVPQRIAVTSHEGHFDLLHPSETQVSIRVQIDDEHFSITFDQDEGQDVADYDWDTQIREVVKRAKQWIMGGSRRAGHERLAEWIDRDDEDDARLMAIEAAEEEAHIGRLLAPLLDQPAITLRRVIERLVESHNGNRWARETLHMTTDSKTPQIGA